MGKRARINEAETQQRNGGESSERTEGALGIRVEFQFQEECLAEHILREHNRPADKRAERSMNRGETFQVENGQEFFEGELGREREGVCVCVCCGETQGRRKLGGDS